METSFFLLTLIGILSSFVGTLAGGAGLITLPAMMLVGIPIQTGIATNKFSTGFASLTSISYLLKNKELDVKTIISTIFLSFIGGVIGASVTSSISEKTMNSVALVLLIFALFVSLKNKQWVSSVQVQKKKPNMISKCLSFLIAVYDGGFGPGSSTFAILHYMSQQHTYIKAVQLTRVFIFGSCLGAFIVYYQTGFVQWHYAIAMAIGSALGSQIGLLALPRIPLRVAQLMLVSIIVLLIGEMLYKLASS
ncbi:sulfite exporter TauE/SafE family protein [Thermolongibacillus altinsuensis]